MEKILFLSIFFFSLVVAIILLAPSAASGSGRRSSHQAGHVGEVAVPQRGDEVVHQSQLRRLPVDVGRHEEETRLGAQHRVGRQQVLAGAALGTQHGGPTGGQAGQQDAEEEGAEPPGDHVHGG